MARVLIMGLYYPPANFMAGRRLEGWRRHLPSFGYEPLVLTRYYDPEEASGQDFYASSRPTKTLREDWIESDDVVYTKFTRNAWHKLPVPGKVRGLAHFVWPDPDHSGWLQPCSRYLKTTRFKPDLIIASSSPPGVFRVASKLSWRLGIPWIADFRDLWIGDSSNGLSAHLKIALQRKHLRSASGVTAVTDGMAETLRQQLAPSEKPVRIIYNGAEPSGLSSPDSKDEGALSTFREIKASHSIVLTYTGTLYPEQRVEKFLDVISDSNRSGTVNCAVVLCGRHNAADYARWPFVRALGVVSHGTALFLQQQSTALFYPTWPPQQSIFSGKIFELVLSGRPVLVGFTPSHDLEALCRNFKTVSLIKTAEELRDALRQLPEMKTELSALDVPAIATKKYWAGELAGFMDEILRRDV
jgi:glycosyltransferase involved in cell wall biosynthesis